MCLCLLYGVYDFRKRVWVLFGQLRKNLAVDGHIGDFEKVDEFGVRQVKTANGSVDFEVPEVTERAFLRAAVAECVHTRFQHCGASKTNAVFATPAKTLHLFEKVAATLSMLCSSFYAWHKQLFDFLVGKLALNALTQRGRDDHVGTLVAGHFARLAGVKMCLTCFAFDHFTAFGNANALGSGFVGFHGHTGFGKLAAV